MLIKDVEGMLGPQLEKSIAALEHGVFTHLRREQGWDEIVRSCLLAVQVGKSLFVGIQDYSLLVAHSFLQMDKLAFIRDILYSRALAFCGNDPQLCSYLSLLMFGSIVDSREKVSDNMFIIDGRMLFAESEEVVRLIQLLVIVLAHRVLCHHLCF